MKVQTARIDIGRIREDRMGNHLVDATVHFKIQSEFGELELAVPVEGSHGTDHAISDARRKLQEWARALTNAAPMPHAEPHRA